MPYAKVSRRKYYGKRYHSNRSLASKAYSLAKKAYKLPELKYTQIAGSLTAPTSTGSLQCLSVVAAGTGNNTRVGDTIAPTSIKLKGKMTINASATASQVRVILFTWASEAPNTASMTDILSSNSVVSFKSDDERYQSKILYDRVFQLDSVNKPELFFQLSRKLMKRIAFPGSTATSNRNSVYIGIVSDESTNTPTLEYNTRLFYRDA